MAAKRKFDPYAVLGLDREADAAQVKAAHRRNVKNTHPDAGGNPQDFEKVQRAYLMLIDPKRRERFDRTGDVEDDTPPPDPDAGPIGIIASIIGAMIADEQADFTHDYREAVVMTLQVEIEKIEKAVRGHQAPLDKARRLKGRFKQRKADVNKIDGMVDWHIRQIETKIERGREAIKQCRRAQEIMADYDFEKDPPRPVPPQYADQMRSSFFSTTSTSAIW